MNLKTPDLTEHPPRSPRARLGGYSLLPRMLDKGRATIAGKNGDYHYACPNDQQFFDFVGVAPAALKKELARGKGDWEVLEWIQSHAKFKHSRPEIDAWSTAVDQRAPDNPETREYFNAEHRRLSPQRTDIVSWADLLDLDDYVSFGGKA